MYRAEARARAREVRCAHEVDALQDAARAEWQGPRGPLPVLLSPEHVRAVDDEMRALRVNEQLERREGDDGAGEGLSLGVRAPVRSEEELQRRANLFLAPRVKVRHDDGAHVDAVLNDAARHEVCRVLGRGDKVVGGQLKVLVELVVLGGRPQELLEVALARLHARIQVEAEESIGVELHVTAMRRDNDIKNEAGRAFDQRLPDQVGHVRMFLFEEAAERGPFHGHRRAAIELAKRLQFFLHVSDALLQRLHVFVSATSDRRTRNAQCGRLRLVPGECSLRAAVVELGCARCEIACLDPCGHQLCVACAGSECPQCHGVFEKFIVIQ